MKTYITLFFMLVFVVIVLSIGYLCLENYESYSKEEVAFTIDKPYLATVKGLATKNSLEKMVEENDGMLVYKNWESFDIEVPQRILRIKEYKVHGKLKFIVEKTDHDLGPIKLPFVQEIHLDNHIFDISTKLVSPQKNIPSYNKTIQISPLFEGNNKIAQQTHVKISSELKIKKLIPIFFKKFMDDKVKQTNQKDIEQLKNNILNMSNQKSILTFKLQPQGT
jgi:hypothetical protein